MDKNGLYVPLESHDTNLSNLRMENILSNVVKEVVKTEDYFKKLRENILGISQKVKSYDNAIKQLEKQFDQM